MRGSQALLLAAGRGRRAGGPKAWLAWEGRSLLERHVEFLSGLLGPERVRVSIQEAWAERCRALSARVAWVAVDPDASPLASAQALLAGAEEAWTFIHHVDMPVWEAPVFAALAAAAEGRASIDAAVPVHAGRRGHPLLLSPRAVREARALDPARDRLDAWLRARAVREVEWACPSVLENWNAGISRPGS